jgi:hypothetical protein
VACAPPPVVVKVKYSDTSVAVPSTFTGELYWLLNAAESVITGLKFCRKSEKASVAEEEQ